MGLSVSFVCDVKESHTFVASIMAHPCQSARLRLPLRVEVPSRYHWRASSMYPISPASMAIDWYRKGFGNSCVALMPYSITRSPVA